MRINTAVTYYKKQRVGKSPATYTARQPNGKGTTVHAKIRLDPSLKGNADLRRLVLLHEKRELKAWGNGLPKQSAHKVAQRATKKDNTFDTVPEYWRLIEKRKKRK